jgi:Phosphodiester glycosidase/FlgD Ig-like domain
MGFLFARLAAVGLLAALVCASAQGRLAQTVLPVQSQSLFPGVTYDKHVELTPHGPVVYHVITVPPPGGLVSLTPAIAGGTVTGQTETLPQLEQEVTGATVAGIDGDFFSRNDGHPTGVYMQGGILAHGPTPNRSSIGIDSPGGLHVTTFKFVGTWRGSGQRRPLNGINQIPTAGQVVLFTPAWGATTPTVTTAAEVVLEPFPAAQPNTDLTATVTSSGSSGGGTTIPPDGAVLMAVGGSASAKLAAEAPTGGTVTTRIILPDSWANVTSAIGGGPLLVKGGQAVFHSGENFPSTDLTLRNARSAVGQLADGRIVLVAVDGNQPGYSSGMTTYELARTMVALGAQTASALSYGGAVSAAFDGSLLSRPSGSLSSQVVKDALLVEYVGVYAPAPSSPVVTQSGVERLAYRVVRPSSVTATLTGPDGSSSQVDAGPRQPGNYHFTTQPFTLEGTWHWHIVATDDLGRQSVADQAFRYDNTLSGVSATKAASAVAVHFTLSRAATVTLQIETPSGTVVHAGTPAPAQPGAGVLQWDGTLDGINRAYSDKYVARVTATSAIGTMTLTAPFTLRG